MRKHEFRPFCIKMANPLAYILAVFLLPVLFLSAPSIARSDDTDLSTYSFGGKCSSQGSWTFQALNHTHELVDIAQRLKADKRCQKLADGFLSSLPRLEQTLTDAATEQHSVGGLNRLAQEMTALSQFNSSNTQNKIDVVKLLLKRAVQYSAETAKLSSSSMPPPGASDRSEKIAEDIFSFGRRLNQTTGTGLDIFNSMITQVADNSECPLNNNTRGQLFAASANMLAAFARGSQSSTGLKLSEAISKFFTTFRDLGYAEVIRKGNDVALLNSVSCLLEMTSESYCSARDARVLWEETKNQTEVRLSGQNRTLYLADRSTVDSRNGTPLMGFYILTQQLPVVSDWLLKILIAVDPKLTTDGHFRNTVLDNVNDFFKKVNEVKSLYNNKTMTIKAYQDRASQINATVDLIGELSATVIGNQRNAATTNFFTQANLPLEIPFRMAGIDPPSEEIKRLGGQFDPNVWLQGNRNNIQGLQDPIPFIEHMGAHLQEIIDAAQLSAIGYYNQWAIVDQQNVVDKSLLGINFNVNEIFASVDSYLENLKHRLIVMIDHEKLNPPAHPIDSSIIGSILDTQVRIHKIQVQLDELHRTSDQFRAASEIANNPDLFAKQIAFEKAAKDFLLVLYDQLNVILSRTGFLSNRMAVYVQYDFQSTIRAQAGEGSLFKDPKFEQSLKFATNVAAYDQIISITGGNPATVRQDISNSMNITRTNLQMIEDLFAPFFAKKIAEMHLRAKHPDAGYFTIQKEIAGRAWADHVNRVPTENRSLDWENLDHMTGFLGWLFHIEPKDRYNSLSVWNMFSIFSTKTVLPADNEFGSARELYAQYCTQSLAFNNLRGIYDLCKGATLFSPFNAPSEPDAKAAFDGYLDVNFAQKAVQDQDKPALNESGRICALREYYRRNYVLYLTKGSGQPAQK